MSHTTRLRAALTAAVRARRDAEADCPNWDYESAGDGHTCCDTLADAEARVRRLRRKLRDAEARAAEGGFWGEYTSA